MIVVKVELHSAITGKVKLLGKMLICNVGCSPDGKRGDYAVVVAKKTDADNDAKILKAPLRRGKVEGYPRLAYNVWRLVARALASSFPEERVPMPDFDSVEHEQANG